MLIGRDFRNFLKNLGDHQFARPNNYMVAGTNANLTMVTSTLPVMPDARIISRNDDDLRVTQYRRLSPNPNDLLAESHGTNAGTNRVTNLRSGTMLAS